jgi:UDP-glucose 4-epimerase
MRVLITGGAGFIGSHLAAALQDAAEVRVLDNFRSGRRANLAGIRHDLVEGSILDRALLARCCAGVDVVYHLAALVSVPESVGDPLACVELNVTGTLNVLAAAAAAGVGKVVFSSSAAVYGDNPEVPKRESMLPEPKSPYAVSKLDGEYYADFYRREHGLATACLRFFNVFGPRQDPRGAYAAAVPVFIERALRGEDILIHGDGGQTRDFVYVQDIVAALRFVAGEPAAAGVYNAGYGASVTINELAATITRLAGGRSSIVYGPERPGDVRHSRAAPDRLRALGWRPAHSMAEGLAATVAWFHDRV